MSDLASFTADLPAHVIARMQEKLADEMATALRWKFESAVSAEVERFIAEEVTPAVREAMKAQAPEIVAGMVRAVQAATAKLEEELTKKAITNITEKYGAIDKIAEAIFTGRNRF